MIIANNTRHAVAAILRELGDSERVAILRAADRLSSSELGVAATFGIGFIAALERAGFVATESVRLHELLADLIEPPTAHAIQRCPGAFYECSACGQDAWVTKDKVTRFCPNCGARILEGMGSHDYE